MALRYAAALALTGWYLMVPPFSGTNVFYDRPLSEWQPAEIYSTKKECEEGKREAVEQLTALVTEAWKMPPTPKLKALQAGRCFASDDPRLKLNKSLAP